MRPAVLASQERTLQVDPKDRGVSPGFGCRDLNLRDQNVGDAATSESS